MHWRGGAGQVPDAVDFQSDRLGDVVADQFKARMTDPLGDVGLAASEVVIEADHLLAGCHQTVHQVRAHEAGAARDQVAGKGSRHGSALPHGPHLQPRCSRRRAISLGTRIK